MFLPATASLKGRYVDDASQGQVQGAVWALKSATKVLGPAIFAFLFNSLDRISGAAGSKYIFFTGGALCCFGVVISFAVPSDLLNKCTLTGDDYTEPAAATEDDDTEPAAATNTTSRNNDSAL
jgi:hypothetical protein